MRFYRIYQKKIIDNFLGSLRNAGNEFINKELAFILGPVDVFSVYFADTKKVSLIRISLSSARLSWTSIFMKAFEGGLNV